MVRSSRFTLAGIGPAVLLAFGFSLALLGAGGGCADRSAAGEGSDDGAVDEALRDLCDAGCVQFETCLPDSFAVMHGDQATCSASCAEAYLSRGPTCSEPGLDYLECTVGVACEDWPALLTGGKEGTGCEGAWSDVVAACTASAVTRPARPLAIPSVP